MNLRSGPFTLSLMAVLGLTSCDKPQPPAVQGRNLLPGPGISSVEALPQNWTNADANRFYNTTQGSQMMPYAWWLHLEQDDSTKAFRDEANVREFGYLPRAPESSGNPDGLPVGFVKNGVALGLTCAACHTGQVNFKGKSFVIDGGPTMADAATLMRKLVSALQATLMDEAKFARFAQNVLANTTTGQTTAELKTEMMEVLDRRSKYNMRNLPHEPNLQFGPGRLDAFDAIFNEVAVRFAQVPENPTQCDAPVSYPFLWDTPQHDRVQWNGSAENKVVAGLHIGALGRNVGEVLGVFADVDTTQQEQPLGGYESSVNTGTLSALEELLRGLWSPQWPAAFGELDAALTGRGAALFTTHCAECHKPIQRTDPNRTVIAQMSDVQTDASMARNAATRKAKSGVFEGRIFVPPSLIPRKLEATEPIGNLLSHLGQRVLVGRHPMLDPADKAFNYDVLAEISAGQAKISAVLNDVKFVEGTLSSARVKELSKLEDGAQTLTTDGTKVDELPAALKAKFTKATAGAVAKVADLAISPDAPDAETAVVLQYKARPLNGIWATAPYLHNGSVLNLDELLKPASARLATFQVGSREFDPKHVGFVNDGGFKFDTTAQPGNSNAGHEYGGKVFTDEERAALIEYMKGL